MSDEIIKKTLIENYWVNKLSGKIESENSNVTKAKEFDNYSFKVNKNDSEKILKISAHRFSSESSIYYALISIIFSKLLSKEEILISVSGYDGRILFFKNIVKETLTIKDLILMVKNEVIETLQYQEYDYDIINKLLKKRGTDFNSRLELGFHYEGYNVHSDFFKKNDFQFRLLRDDSDNYEVEITYNKNKYDINFVNQFTKRFTKLLEYLHDGVNTSIKDLDLLGDEERKRLLVDFNQNIIDFPVDKTYSELFEAEVEKNPEKAAVCFGDKELSYRELNEKANQLARHLRETFHLKADDMVAVLMDRSDVMLISILAVFKAGAAYLPIDKEYPTDRISFILNDASVKTVLTCGYDKSSELEIDQKLILDLKNEVVFNSELKENLERISNPEDLAYIIYTSGSTGKPKGAMVEQRGMVNHLYTKITDLELNSESVIAQNASHCFDISVWQYLSALILGGKTVVYSNEMVLDVDGFLESIENDKLTILELVPSYLSLVLDRLESMKERKLENLHYLMVTGEELKHHLVKRFLEIYPKIPLVNAYGPTEASDDITHCVIREIPEETRIPIGKPVSNMRLYVLDEKMNLCPIGVKGEICVSGIGVGRGYLNDKEKTEKAFLEDPFAEGNGHRMYKTGDIGSWEEDGSLSFYGRRDEQVKIRGFRIELGEIEEAIHSYAGVNEVVVIARGEENKELAAYIVSKEEIDFDKLRDHLDGILPYYMIPAYFVAIESIPLTPNGKTDKKKLNQIKINDTLTSYQNEEARNEIESILVRLWEEVLGRKSVGINDNFFMIGGDSIKAIQVASRLINYNYKLEVKDLFNKPTIKEIAKTVKEFDDYIDQSIVTGEIHLSAAQKEFLYSETENKNHYNHSVMLFEKKFDPDDIRSIFLTIENHHDVLRANFIKKNGKYIQKIRGKSTNADLKIFDFYGKENLSLEIEKAATELQESMNIELGSLMKLALFNCDDGDRLLIIVHHLLTDGVSWRIFLDDVNTAYKQLSENKKIELPLKTHSFRTWTEKIHEFAKSDAIKKDLNYWQSVNVSDIKELRKEKNLERRYRANANVKYISFSKEITEDLLSSVNNAFNTEINEILLTALSRAVKHWQNLDYSLVKLEGHGREELFKKITTDRTIGWFTSVYPIILKASDDVMSDIIYNKEMLRRIPNKGVSYGILKEITEDNSEVFKLNPQLLFNYLGSFDNSSSTEKGLQLAKESTGKSESDTLEQEADIEILGIISSGQLYFSLYYQEEEFTEDSVSEFADGLQSSLEEIIKYCKKQNSAILTPFDLTFKELSFEYINEVQGEYPKLDDVYTLSPMQKGMLFHHIMNEGTGSEEYFQQYSYKLRGNINLDYFQKSYENMTMRYDILRTNFIWEDLKEPLQIVQSDLKGSFKYIDIRSEKDKENYISKFKDNERKEGFDLKNESLMKVTLIQFDEDRYEVIWSNHHILMDGWCVSFLISDFSQNYAALVQGKTYQKEHIGQYKTYINWLNEQDQEKAKSYWANYLQSYPDQKVKIPGHNSNNGIIENASYDYLYDLNATEKLTSFAKNNQVTLFTLLQFVWAYCLSKYNSVDEVLYGSIVSGRPAEIEGIEEMIGLFINTRPVRINLSQIDQISETLKSIQESMLEGIPYEYYSLADAQAESDVEVDHIFIFQNYPVAKEVEKAVENSSGDKNNYSVESMSIFEQTNYDLVIEATQTDQLHISIKYNHHSFETEKLFPFLDRYFHLLLEISENNIEKLSDLDLLGDEERKRLLVDFNQNIIDFPVDKTYSELFEAEVEKNPEKAAVCFGDKELSYRELNEKANQLARHLRETFHLKADDMVAVLMDRSDVMLISILAVFKAGAAYLPIDKEYPTDRISFILNDASVKTVLTCGYDKSSELEIDQKLILDLKNEVVFNSELKENLERISNPEDLAYIIYTSGSTGKPKGAMVEQRGMVNHLYTKITDLELNSESVIAQNASHCFDISVWQYLSALILGGKTVVYSNEMVLDVDGFLESIENDKLTILELVPSYLSLVLDRLESMKERKLENLHYLMVTGEELKHHLVKRFLEIYPKIPLVNAYGPTEASDDITHCVIREIPEETRIPIGKPVSNMRLYVLDEKMNLCPIGVKGEICVSGIGVGRGYLNDKEKTEKAFLEDPFAEGNGHRMYKTGDIGSWEEDGSLSFYGRRDEQVKIRGFRIELGEIEEAIHSYAGVNEVVVIARGEENKELAAYIVSKEEIDFDKLRDHLDGILPYYMIPAYFVAIESIPLTPNGKTDKKKLAEIELGLPAIEDKYQAPRGKIESILAKIWEEVLARPSISRDENFFMIGGHSIKAIQILTRVHKEIAVKLTLNDIFELPTIKKLTEYIKSLEKSSFENIEKIPEAEFYDLSEAQRQMWFLYQLSDNKHTFNAKISYQFGTELNIGILEKTICHLIEKHENLRSRFHILSDSPKIRILSSEESGISIDHINLQDSMMNESELNKVLEGKIKIPFNIEEEALIRFHLFSLKNGKYILLINMNHLITDGVSTGILISELIDIYTKVAQSEEEQIEELSIQYKDYAYWQNKQVNDHLELKNFWHEYLAGEFTFTEIKADKSRTEVNSKLSKGYQLELNSELSEKVLEIIKENNSTLFVFYLAVVNIFLSRFTGEKETVIGTISSGRNHIDLESIIGLFFNTVLVRSKLDFNKSFTETLQIVAENTANVFKHDLYPYSKIAKEVQGQFNILVTTEVFRSDSQDEPDYFEQKELHLSSDEHLDYDLGIGMFQIGKKLVMHTEYNIEMYSENTIHNIMTYLFKILESVVAKPNKKIVYHDYLDKYERSKIYLEREYSDYRIDLSLGQSEIENISHEFEFIKLKNSYKISPYIFIASVYALFSEFNLEEDIAVPVLKGDSEYLCTCKPLRLTIHENRKLEDISSEINEKYHQLDLCFLNNELSTKYHNIFKQSILITETDKLIENPNLLMKMMKSHQTDLMMILDCKNDNAEISIAINTNEYCSEDLNKISESLDKILSAYNLNKNIAINEIEILSPEEKFKLYMQNE